MSIISYISTITCDNCSDILLVDIVGDLITFGYIGECNEQVVD
jgi:hypothetical protein